jgi:hypothetical protein
MPTGRAQTYGGVGWISPRLWRVCVCTMAEWRRDQRELPDAVHTAKLTAALRQAFRLYLLTVSSQEITRSSWKPAGAANEPATVATHGISFTIRTIGRCYLTPTERRKALGKLVHSAKRLTAEPSSRTWRGRFIKAFIPLQSDANMKAIVYRHLTRKGYSPTDLWQNLKEQMPHRQLQPLRDQDIRAVACLSQMDVTELVQTRTKWRDPALATLVREVAPIWMQVTGYSPGPISINAEADHKWHPFSNWLRGVFVELGLDPPPEGRVEDLTRKNWKNPATVTGNL